MVPRIAKFVARLAVTAWIGAALLFVMVGIREVTSPDFTSEVKDRLVLLRFPMFYLMGFTLITIGSLATAVVPLVREHGIIRWWVVRGLLLVALLGMAFDYFLVYRPLAALITPPGKVRTAEFEVLHQRSENINLWNWGVCCVAAGFLNWPRRR